MRSVLLTPIALAYIPSLIFAVTLSYDTAYDVRTSSLATVACSDGRNGLLTKGFTTFDSLPTFPFIGASSAVEGWNSTKCGTCWQLTYTNTTTKGKKSIKLLAVDHIPAGYNIALAAMNEITGGNAVQLGRVDVTSEEIGASECSL